MVSLLWLNISPTWVNIHPKHCGTPLIGGREIGKYMQYRWSEWIINLFLTQIYKSNYILGSLYDIVVSIKIIIGVRLFYFKDLGLPWPERGYIIPSLPPPPPPNLPTQRGGGRGAGGGGQLLNIFLAVKIRLFEFLHAIH